MELSLLILVCIHKSYIVYLEVYVVPIGHGFSFLVMEKSWKINVEKAGAPCYWFPSATYGVQIRYDNTCWGGACF